MGTCGTNFLVLTRSVLGSLRSGSMFLAGAGCMYVLTVWRMEKMRMLSWRSKCHQVTTLSRLILHVPWAPGQQIQWVLEAHCQILVLCRVLSEVYSFWFYYWFTVAQFLCLLARNLIWDCIPSAKMLAAATEIPVAMDVTPSVADDSPMGKTRNPFDIFGSLSPTELKA